MATNVLPPLHLARNGSERDTSSLSKALDKPQRSSRSSGPNPHDSRPRVAGTKGKERSAAMKDIDPASYRRSVLHNICTDMLEKGFHLSFAELFDLVERQRRDHAHAGPAAILLEPLIEGNFEKLDQLRLQLTSAETATRTGDLDAVFMAQRRLAQEFEQSGDTWLSDHFYRRCLETGSRIQSDGQRKEGEAHCHVGLALENRGSLMEACQHLETFHGLAHKHHWHTEGGESLHQVACEHLRRVYTKMAEESDCDDPKAAITHLRKAHNMAKEGGDSYQEGLAGYRLGNAYESVGEHDTAIQCYKSYLERCKYHAEDKGMGKAYEALARAHESKGDIESAVEYLELFVNVAERVGHQEPLAKACSAIGTMRNTLGDYEVAVEYFGRCCDLCTQLGDKDALYSARVQYGIARGHQFMSSFSALVGEHSQSSAGDLVAWKDSREVQGEGEEEEVEEAEEEEERSDEMERGGGGVEESERGHDSDSSASKGYSGM